MEINRDFLEQATKEQRLVRTRYCHVAMIVGRHPGHKVYAVRENGRVITCEESPLDILGFADDGGLGVELVCSTIGYFIPAPCRENLECGERYFYVGMGFCGWFVKTQIWSNIGDDFSRLAAGVVYRRGGDAMYVSDALNAVLGGEK